MRWLVVAFVIAGRDQGERPPPPAYGADSFTELSAVTVTDMDVPPDRRRIKISGDGILEDEREQQALRHRQVLPRRFAELVQELKGVGFLKQSDCPQIDHGRHMTLTLSLPEGRNQIYATTCNVLREPIRQLGEQSSNSQTERSREARTTCTA